MTRAGDVVRRHARGEGVDAFELGEALDVIRSFRREWEEPPHPLAKVVVGLREMAQARGVAADVTQRLKRAPRIVEKLLRPEHATMRLPQMEDIGGCRVVVPSLADLLRLRTRILERWHDHALRELDYIAHPKVDGYRAIHVVVERDGKLIEIQLRTDLQHRWAEKVERLEKVRRLALRGGRGPEDLVEALRYLASYLAVVDAGGRLPPDWEANRFVRRAMESLAEPE